MINTSTKKKIILIGLFYRVCKTMIFWKKDAIYIMSPIKSF